VEQGGARVGQLVRVVLYAAGGDVAGIEYLRPRQQGEPEAVPSNEERLPCRCAFACSTWPHAQPALSHSHLGAPQAAHCQQAAQESTRATPSCWTGRAPKGRVQACLQVQGVKAAQAAERVPGLEHDLNELLLVRRGRLVQLQPQLRAAGSARGFSNSDQRALREPGVRRGAHPEVKSVHLAEVHL